MSEIQTFIEKRNVLKDVHERQAKDILEQIDLKITQIKKEEENPWIQRLPYRVPVNSFIELFDRLKKFIFDTYINDDSFEKLAELTGNASLLQESQEDVPEKHKVLFVMSEAQRIDFADKIRLKVTKYKIIKNNPKTTEEEKKVAYLQMFITCREPNKEEKRQIIEDIMKEEGVTALNKEESDDYQE